MPNYIMLLTKKTIKLELTDKGVDFLSGKDNPNFFVMPEMGTEIAKIENQGLSSEEKHEAAEKEDLFRDFSVKIGTYTYTKSALKGLCHFLKKIRNML